MKTNINIDNDTFSFYLQHGELWVYKNENDIKTSFGSERLMLECGLLKSEILSNKIETTAIFINEKTKNYVIDELKFHRENYLKAIDKYEKLMVLK